METSPYIELLAIFALIVANGFFALSEFSLIASRRSKLNQDIEDGKTGAAAAEKIHRDPDRFLATVQVGITMMGTVAGVFGGATLVNRLQDFLSGVSISLVSETATGIAVVAVAAGITAVSVVIGELVPKYVALSQPERYARMVARPMTLFIKITAVFAGLLSRSANLFVRMIGIRKQAGESPITEEEINQMILDGRKKGVFDATEEKLIRSVFDFADSTVRRAMTPRTEVVGINLNAPHETITRTIVEEGYSRFPIFEGNLDRIVGILYTKDLILQQTDPELIILSDMIRKPMFVPDSMPLSKLLDEFQRKKNHMAIVLDEFGGTAGIITLEDILEELVGEIQDEYDEEQPPLVKHSDTVAYADGAVWPGDINDLLKSRLPEDEAETLAGLVIHRLGHIPEQDEHAVIADLHITVLERQENRLIRLKLEKTQPDNDNQK